MGQEAETLKAIQSFLEMKKILYVRVNPTRIIGKGKFVRVRASQKGAPDLIIFFPKQTITVEVKSADGELRPEQKAWKEKAGKIGLPYCVVKSFGEFLGILTIKI